MKYYRYMSFDEYEKLMAGEELISNNKHETARTASEGFCFLGEKCAGYPVDITYDLFMSGIVSPEVLVEFETGKALTPSWGVYADPQGDYYDTIIVDEYCTPQYSKKTLSPTLVMFCVDLYNYMPPNAKPTWEVPSDEGLQQAKLLRIANKLYCNADRSRTPGDEWLSLMEYYQQLEDKGDPAKVIEELFDDKCRNFGHYYEPECLDEQRDEDFDEVIFL